ncbi:MAG: CpaF family protein [Anaerolineae bacterium]|nr:CpaF family protein [Anaerolineae bacterium]
MGSFLSRRLQESKETSGDSPDTGFSVQSLRAIAADTLHEASAAPEPDPERQAEERPAQKGSIPPKRRTTPKVAQLRKQLRARVLATPDEADRWTRNPEHERVVEERLKVLLQRNSIEISDAEYRELRECIYNDVLGLGAIEPLVHNTNISEIMVNGPDLIYAEHKGRLQETEYVFDDEDHIQWTAQRIIRPLGRALNRENLMVDARLPDGSRVHVIMPPSALCGTTITIRKFPEKPLTVEDLIRFGSFTNEVADFLEACVVSRLNIVVSGGTGSGKTTLLNVLSSFIPDKERIITVEDSAELQLKQRHVVSLETAPSTSAGKGRLEIRDLVKGCLRMRPDRIVVGECRSGEALDMLQAMNTGHDGSLTTVHANSPRDCIARLETLALMAGMDLPVLVIRKQIASAVHLIIQQARLNDGSRKVTYITEIQGMEGESVTQQDLFVYRTPGQTSPGASHAGGGTLEPTGFRPKFMDVFEQHGFKLGAKIFGLGKKSFTD